ncbi:SIR2 family protein [Marinicrinis lubricantis]|uniref:SIR2 family protein n=1 Tax=Marinicrinis lubricantis TaxID=2086470 RepID=A0ABW1IPT7_9BACL
MWINKDINLPDKLFTALKDRRLVIFVGAGVSMGIPSKLPDFEQLASEVSLQVGGHIKKENGEPIDRYLGRIKKHGPNVNKIVAQIIGNPESKPTQLHNDLLSIFDDVSDVRIVTTNFDTHFSSVNSFKNAKQFPEYRAPALPLGHRFHGIVYLHGCVDQEPEEMILTDSDFGRAYLTEGWATRFLQAMFDKYVVLFVGYSHNDPIMQYLARGLPPHTERYAFTPHGNEEHWKFLDVQPIFYPLRDGPSSHKALNEAIEAWSHMNKMGGLLIMIIA